MLSSVSIGRFLLSEVGVSLVKGFGGSELLCLSPGFVSRPNFEATRIPLKAARTYLALHWPGARAFCCLDAMRSLLCGLAPCALYPSLASRQY